MSSVVGRIGKKEVTVTFNGGSVTFKHKNSTVKRVEKAWFVYFQRVSKRLKTCDAVFFDGNELTEFSTSQSSIEKIRDEVNCACYVGGLDPLPWKKIVRDAKKHEWDIHDWQHHMEADSSESEPDSDADWVPDNVDSEDDEDDSSDDEPEAKRRRVAVEQSDLDSESE